MARTLNIEGTGMIYRNFAGEAGPYNNEGDRSVSILIPEDMAEDLIAEGWNVKIPEKHENQEDHDYTPLPRLQVKLGSKPEYVKIVTVAGDVKTRLIDPASWDMLDWCDYTTVDVIINPYHWERPNGDKGVTAYLKAIYVNLETDIFTQKYGI